MPRPRVAYDAVVLAGGDVLVVVGLVLPAGARVYGSGTLCVLILPTPSVAARGSSRQAGGTCAESPAPATFHSISKPE